MRTERTYSLLGGFELRQDATIEIEETFFCENPECERTHDDPTALWDTRTYRTLATVYHRKDGERIIAALQLLDERTKR